MPEKPENIWDTIKEQFENMDDMKEHIMENGMDKHDFVEFIKPQQYIAEIADGGCRADDDDNSDDITEITHLCGDAQYNPLKQFCCKSLPPIIANHGDSCTQEEDEEVTCKEGMHWNDCGSMRVMTCKNMEFFDQYM